MGAGQGVRGKQRKCREKGSSTEQLERGQDSFAYDRSSDNATFLLLTLHKSSEVNKIHELPQEAIRE